MTSCLCSLALIFFAATTVACSGGVRDTRGTTDISGTVVDMDALAPVAGAQVLVGDTLTITDWRGNFTVPDVVLPYDIAITADGGLTASVYYGVESAAQSYRLLFTSSPIRQGTVIVNLPAADTPDVVGVVFLELLDNLTYKGVPFIPNPTAAVRTITPAWAGAWEVNVRVHAFQYQADPATGAPIHYIGYDTHDGVLTPGAAFAWDVSWKPPPFPEGTLSFTVSLPGGYTHKASMLTMLEAGTSVMLATSKAPGLEVSFPLPELPGMSFLLEVSAEGGGGWSVSSVPGVSADTKGLVVAVDPAPTLLAPAEGGTIGAGSTVTWESGAEGAAYISLSLDCCGTGSEYFLYSGGTSATLPDLSALGASLPSGTPYQIQMWRDGRAASVEDLAANWLGPLGAMPSTLGHTNERKVTAR